ncbi:MAG: hypothetical protein F4107_11170 [Gemmatimonadetes bacterium]|nr:hypothetical protein [Gemmatimonadota bacterium]
MDLAEAAQGVDGGFAGPVRTGEKRLRQFQIQVGDPGVRPYVFPVFQISSPWNKSPLHWGGDASALDRGMP